MKSYFVWLGVVLMLSMMTACGSAKNGKEKSPVDTFILPGADLVSGNGLIRAWAAGTSDNQMTARKKARTEALEELATQVNTLIGNTTEKYTTSLTEGMNSKTKELFDSKTQVTVKQSLQGAAVIFDRWKNDEVKGTFTNYIVMELKGEAFLKNLYKELGKIDGLKVDEDLLDKIFMEQIDQAGR